MKKLFLLLLTVIVTNVFAQNKIENGYFKTEFTTGIGEKVSMSFSLDSVTIDKITKTPSYIYWDSITFADSANAKYIEKHKDKTHMEMFLMSNAGMGSIQIKYALKIPNSYTPLQSTNNSIYVTEDKSIVIRYDIKGQNSYGNMIFNTAAYYISFVNGKSVTQPYIF
jgi:hypothetical protein